MTIKKKSSKKNCKYGVKLNGNCKKKTGAKKSPKAKNPWLVHLNKFHKKNKDMSLKEAMMAAKKTYKKVKFEMSCGNSSQSESSVPLLIPESSSSS